MHSRYQMFTLSRVKRPLDWSDLNQNWKVVTVSPKIPPYEILMTRSGSLSLSLSRWVLQVYGRTDKENDSNKHS